MILQISVIAHSCQAYLYQGMSFLANRFWARAQREPGHKSSSTSRSNQTKPKLIMFSRRFHAFSTKRKPIARAKGDPGAIGKSKEDLRD
jgi:hypothetical protein